MSIGSGRRALSFSFAFLFLLSGTTALIYEVLWIRELRVVLGSTIYSSSIVFATYLLGLMTGALVMQAFLRSFESARAIVRTYALVEFLIAAFGFASLSVLGGLDAIYLSLIRDGSISDNLAIQMTVAFGVLLVPTFLMGTTLPMLVEVFSRLRTPSLHRWVGLLYGINTFGGAVGAAIGGFLLIPFFGLSTSTYIAACMNLFLGFAMLAIASSGAIEPTAQAELEDDPTATRVPRGFVLLLCVVLGACTLSLEILYLRFLLPIIGISTFAVSTVISTFIAALGIGSAVGSRWSDSRGDPRAVLAGLAIAITLLLAIQTWWMDHTPVLFAEIFLSLGHSFNSAIISGIACAVILIVPVVFLFGATFPFFVSWNSEKGMPLSMSSAWIYSTGTFGNVIGAFAAPFLLIPTIGVQRSFLVIAIITLLTAAVAYARSLKRPLTLALIAVSIFAIGLGSRPWNVKLVASGIFYQVKAFKANDPDNWDMVHDRNVDYFHEGSSITASVVGNEDLRILQVDGKPVASNIATDLRVQYFLALIPYLLQGRLDTGLVIGLGTGATCGTLSLTTNSVECVELSEEIVDATALFATTNFEPAKRENIDIIFEDGRKFARTTTKKYDIISSDPIHPWAAGSSSLYSVEHLESLQDLLAPDGILTQWLPLYEISEFDLLTVLRSFSDVFPYVYVWLSTDSAVLIGKNQPLQSIGLEDWPEPLPEAVQGILAQFEVRTPSDFLAGFSIDRETLAKHIETIAPNTEDMPVLEFSAPKSLYKNTIPGNLLWFVDVRKDFDPGSLLRPPNVAPPALHDVFSRVSHEIAGWAWKRRQRFDLSAEEYLQASRPGPDGEHAVESALEIAAYFRSKNAIPKARGILGRLLEKGIDPVHEWRKLGIASLEFKSFRQSVAAFEHVTQSEDAYPEDFINLGTAYEQLGRDADARTAYLRALELDPESLLAREKLDALASSGSPSALP